MFSHRDLLIVFYVWVWGPCTAQWGTPVGIDDIGDPVRFKQDRTVIELDHIKSSDIRFNTINCKFVLDREQVIAVLDSLSKRGVFFHPDELDSAATTRQRAWLSRIREDLVRSGTWKLDYSPEDICPYNARGIVTPLERSCFVADILPIMIDNRQVRVAINGVPVGRILKYNVGYGWTCTSVFTEYEAYPYGLIWRRWDSIYDPLN